MKNYLTSFIFIFTLFIFIGLLPFALSAAEITITQEDTSFKQNGKLVEKITINKGDVVHFLNQDPIFHNLFSLSDLYTFDLGSYPKGVSKSVTFDKAGMTDVECAIHPEMYMEIEVK